MQVLTIVEKPNPVSFGYHTLIKDLYLEGKLPMAKFDIYGLPLKKKTVSNEHMDCFCHSHDSTLKNIALADKYMNNLRGEKPLKDFTTDKNVLKYFMQFVGVVVNKGKRIFDGTRYAKEGIETCRKLGFDV